MSNRTQTLGNKTKIKRAESSLEPEQLCTHITHPHLVLCELQVDPTPAPCLPQQPHRPQSMAELGPPPGDPTVMVMNSIPWRIELRHREPVGLLQSSELFTPHPTGRYGDGLDWETQYCYILLLCIRRTLFLSQTQTAIQCDNTSCPLLAGGIWSVERYNGFSPFSQQPQAISAGIQIYPGQEHTSLRPEKMLCGMTEQKSGWGILTRDHKLHLCSLDRLPTPCLHSHTQAPLFV